MSWNYRLVRYTTEGQECYGVMEVYYDEAGVPERYGIVSLMGFETADDVQATVTRLMTCGNRPVLDVPASVADPFA